MEIEQDSQVIHLRLWTGEYDSAARTLISVKFSKLA